MARTELARHRIFQDIVEDQRIMALCDQLLLPNYLLTASQATDDSFYPIPRPRPMISLSTIVAVEPFTAANGGTEIIPGSHPLKALDKDFVPAAYRTTDSL